MCEIYIYISVCSSTHCKASASGSKCWGYSDTVCLHSLFLLVFFSEMAFVVAEKVVNVELSGKGLILSQRSSASQCLSREMVTHGEGNSFSPDTKCLALSLGLLSLQNVRNEYLLISI